MPRWWLVTIAIAGAWLVALSVMHLGVLTRFSLGSMRPFLEHGVFAICLIASFQCARTGSAAWCGTLAFLAALLNTLAPPQWPQGWEQPFHICGGVVMLAFSIRHWK